MEPGISLSPLWAEAAQAVNRVFWDYTDTAGDIISLNDGESKVTFANKNETAKIIRGLATDAKASLDDLVARYNLYQSEPRQVGGIEAAE